MKTRQDLVNEAIAAVDALAAGQAPSAEDASYVDGQVDPLLGNLAKRGVYPFGDADQIEDDAFLDLAEILGDVVAPRFGKSRNAAARLACENRLRVLTAETVSGQPLRAVYY